MRQRAFLALSIARFDWLQEISPGLRQALRAQVRRHARMLSRYLADISRPLLMHAVKALRPSHAAYFSMLITSSRQNAGWSRLLRRRAGMQHFGIKIEEGYIS